MKKVYVLEPLMHDGKLYERGESFDADDGDIGALVSSGRGTCDTEIGEAAVKAYQDRQKAAAQK